jgi:Secretion system C-terminal sorting domain
MKHFLLLCAIALAIPTLSVAQCNPADHDWAGAVYGVSPDPNAGETFEDGILGNPYADIVYVKAPTTASEVDSAYKNFDVAIDSLSLDSITIFNGFADVSLTNIGLNISCNNLNDSPNPCMFMPGGSYCGDIWGTPTVAGEFPVKIYTTVYVTFGIFVQGIGYEFENYTLSITDPANSIAEVKPNLSDLNNWPNPADDNTQISFNLEQSSKVTVEVRSLLGALVYSKGLNAKSGDNSLVIETNALSEGIYLYTVKTGDLKLTKKLIVQR